VKASLNPLYSKQRVVELKNLHLHEVVVLCSEGRAGGSCRSCLSEKRQAKKEVSLVKIKISSLRDGRRVIFLHNVDGP